MTLPEQQEVRNRIEALRDATGRLEAAVRDLLGRDDDAMALPSRLPDWTVGHVVTHLARNADGLRRVLAGAAVGELLQPYPSPQARKDDILAGARRSAPAIVLDLTAADGQFADAVDAQPHRVWAATIDLGRGGPAPAEVLLDTRLAEVELHHHDLGADAGLDLLTAGQASALLTAVLRSYARTRELPAMTLQPQGADPIALGDGGSVVAGSAVELVGWLSGRTDGTGLRAGDGLPELPPW
jgi:maleylpyruvate isomerase